MKKLLPGLFLFFIGGMAYSQCTPDPQYTAPGIYPDSATNFVTAYVGQPYEQIVTAVVPADTCVVIVPNTPCQTFIIDSILVNSISNLPPGFSYECVLPNCAFYGGSSGCLRIYSTTNPTISDTGTYDLSISLTTYTFVQQTNTVDYYKIVVVDTSAGTNVGEIDRIKIDLEQNNPNPVSGLTNIDFANGTNSDVVFQVINLLGDVVHEEKRFAKRGKNRIVYDATNLSPGIYLYAIDNGYVKYSKKMMVK